MSGLFNHEVVIAATDLRSEIGILSMIEIH